ncbi:hypothetical protein IFM89_035422 [Coptis chinensis]|uniref:Cytochrome P450 n=1 Tax=Coptis chinensis TaxID=261450 RepID=A0A835HLL7_9MAGN|nr:hypothetical protein IFM89_035422 [Coptis chinensis]
MAFLLFLSLFLCSSFLYYFLLRLTQPTRSSKLPPGSYGFPLIGETLQLISAYKTENPEPFIDDRVNRYGTLFTTHIFGERTVFSADPEVNRFVLQNEGKLFESSYPTSISNLLGKHSLLLMKGSLHKRMHSLTMSFANSSTIRDNLFFDIDRIVSLNLHEWTDRVLLQDQAKKITFALTVKQLMSFDPGEWTENLRKEYLQVINGFFTIPLPFYFTTYNRAIKARTKVAEALRTVVRERRKEFAENDRKKDMLGALLEAESGFSDEEIVDFLVALLVAGYDTTSITMTLAVKFLTETPLALAQLKKLLQKVSVDNSLFGKLVGKWEFEFVAHNYAVYLLYREEHEGIRAQKNEGEALQWSDYKAMPFTQCVINETLRVANIISGVFRRATTDVNIKGYTIPKGWKVFTSFRGVHLDQDHYTDARTFNPWRWENKNNNSIAPSTASVQGNTYTPFGGGPRLCPGYELARVEISVFLHHLLTTFSWEPAEKDKLVFFPTNRTLKHYPLNVYRQRKP